MMSPLLLPIKSTPRSSSWDFDLSGRIQNSTGRRLFQSNGSVLPWTESWSGVERDISPPRREKGYAQGLPTLTYNTMVR